MAAFNFQQRFKPMILSGRKHHTIRAERKDGRRPKPGERLHLFCGMRTKAIERLADPTCTKVADIRLDLSRDLLYIEGHGHVFKLDIWIEETLLDLDEAESLAFHDGFDSLAEMTGFWDMKLFPFNGFITFWNPNEAIARRFHV